MDNCNWTCPFRILNFGSHWIPLVATGNLNVKVVTTVFFLENQFFMVKNIFNCKFFMTLTGIQGYLLQNCPFWSRCASQILCPFFVPFWNPKWSLQELIIAFLHNYLCNALMCIQDLMVDISKMPSVIRNLRNGCELAALRFYKTHTKGMRLKW